MILLALLFSGHIQAKGMGFYSHIIRRPVIHFAPKIEPIPVYSWIVPSPPNPRT